ncbi:MAG: hypothetical protein IT555_11030 [Acetobacteraceae bacterium]|nr:hypothetical protein [Acetobacteraceae bacterium]
MTGLNNSVDALFLAEVLATRMCHDLAGQVNALVGAVEVMRDEPAPDPEAISLASDASDSLVRHLRLARVAWGRGGMAMGVEEWRGLVDFMPRRGVRIDLSGLPQAGSFAPAAARLSLNVLLMASECLPGGGVIEVAGQPDHDLLVRIRGPRAAWPAGLSGMLADPALAVCSLREADAMSAARALQAPLTALIAHATGQRISLLFGPRDEEAPPLLVGLAPSSEAEATP